MKGKYNVGDVLIRRKLPQYKGYGQVVVTIVSKDNERYYFDDGSTSIFEHDSHWKLYKPSIFKEIVTTIRSIL